MVISGYEQAYAQQFAMALIIGSMGSAALIASLIV